MDPLTISVISACTALVASIAGPFVTLSVARRQFNATVLSANRQKWIDSLRDLLAELLSLMVSALVVRSQWKENWNKGRGAIESDPALLRKLERMVLLDCKIRLLTNPAEPDHQRLCRAIEVAFSRLQANESAEEDTQQDIRTITELAQSILKREWLRVKHGK